MRALLVLVATAHAVLLRCAAALLLLCAARPILIVARGLSALALPADAGPAARAAATLARAAALVVIGHVDLHCCRA